jgi:hypothetical protein
MLIAVVSFSGGFNIVQKQFLLLPDLDGVGLISSCQLNEGCVLFSGLQSDKSFEDCWILLLPASYDALPNGKLAYAHLTPRVVRFWEESRDHWLIADYKLWLKSNLLRPDLLA